MKRSSIVLSSILIAILGVVVAFRGGRAVAAASAPGSSSRTFEFTYQVHFPATSDATEPVHLWIPYPTKLDPYQTAATNVSITENVQQRLGRLLPGEVP